ncbi:MAG: dienelactone hydrolase family protein [Chitinophagaceae bacterium]|nr:MAG: dienelactone hydrolase family protein [Chitinophagaceae bacterium]
MIKFLSYLLVPIFAITACGENTSKSEDAANGSDTATTNMAPARIKEENISYKDDTTTLNSFIAFNESTAAKRPAVIIVPEWWGLNDYVKMRARQLAELGYVAMAVDYYGNGIIAGNPGDAQKFATPFYTNPALGKSRMDAALLKLRSYAQVDTNNIAAIGYCFGGSMVLNAAKLGENFKGVVSFHGGLAGVPAKKELLKSSILVCHGEADSFVPQAEVDQFKKSMDSIGADLSFKSYPNATHAFTNPEANDNARKFKMPIAYNGAADTASFNDMKAFFGRIFK